MSEFTKGPWVQDKYGQMRGADNRQVEVYHLGLTHQMSEGTPEAISNAHLIAAAPDMYEALQLAQTWLQGWASAEKELAVIDAALAKARGEQ